MSEPFHKSDDTLQLTCRVCEYETEADGYTLEVIGPDEELREDEWYFHLDDAENVEQGVIRNPVIYAFCPDCSPSTLPEVDKESFDIDELVDQLKEKH